MAQQGAADEAAHWGKQGGQAQAKKKSRLFCRLFSYIRHKAREQKRSYTCCRELGGAAAGG